MRIIGFNFTKISAAKLKTSAVKIDIKSNIHIDSIKLLSSDLLKEEHILSIDFDYTIDYTPELAQISFQGGLLISVEESLSKQILKTWEEKGSINSEIRPLIFNTIFTRANIKALDLEQEINLPPHIPMPKISINSEDTQKE